MTRLLITLLSVVAVLGADRVIAWTSEGPPTTGPVVETGDPCSPVRARVHGEAQPIGDDGAAMFRNGFALARFCDAGELEIEMRGTAALGHGALVVVSLGNELMWEGRVDGRRALELTVPRAGWLTIGFLNDAAAEGDDRNVWIDSVSFEPR